MKALLIGNLTLDENLIDGKKHKGPGGAVYFLAKTLGNLGVSITIISPFGSDFPKKSLPHTRLIPDKPTLNHNLVFQNSYKGSQRSQKVKNYSSYQNFKLKNYLADLKETPDLIFVAPVINNLKPEEVKILKTKYTKSFFVLLPQGFFRQIDKDGNIILKDWSMTKKMINLFNLICLSTEDGENIEIKAKEWSMVSSIVIVTRAQRGSYLYQKGERLDTPAFKINKFSDPTGAGDIFAAAFSFFYLKSHKIRKSLKFAHAQAWVTLRARLDKLQYK